MKYLPRIAVLLIMLSWNITSVVAATSEWQDVGGGQVRLLTQVNPTTGDIAAAIEVKLKPGWTTYWRYPGSSGIPPVFDFSTSDGVEFKTVLFPSPSLLGKETMRYAGYKNSVTFPVNGKIYPGLKQHVRLNLLIGICADICIPAQAKMEIKYEDLAQTDLIAGQIINLANKRIPKKITADAAIHKKRETENKKLEISVLHDSSKGAPSLFVEGPNDWYLKPATLSYSDNEKAVFLLDVSNAPAGTDVLSQPLHYTLVTGQLGIEFTH